MTETTTAKKRISIPKVSKKYIRELAKRIKPVIELPNKVKYYIESVDLFEIAYTWNPKATVRAPDLEALCEIRTYHDYGNRAFFKPSIAEVLVQIPKKHLNKVVAFEIVKSPETVDDLRQEREVLEEGYHVAITRLYTRV